MSDKAAYRGMKYISVMPLLAFFIVSCTPHSANNIQLQEDTAVYNPAEFIPEYPGKDESLYKNIVKNIKAPKISKDQLPPYLTVVQFIVEKDGKITHGKTIEGSNEIGQQMIAFVSAKTWKPGHRNGKPIRVLWTLPLRLDWMSEDYL